MIEEEPVGKHNVQVRRVYDDPADGDGTRVLVDRIWPRGMNKEKAALDEWCKYIAPSTELRKWYSHDPDRFAEFTRRYQNELTEPERRSADAPAATGDRPDADAPHGEQGRRHQRGHRARRAAALAQVHDPLGC